MRHLTIFAAALMGLAGQAWAGDTWSKARVMPRAGEAVANYTPDTNAVTPTLNVEMCGGGVLQCFGTDLTAMIQTCKQAYPELGRALSTLECQDINLTDRNCATSYGIPIDPLPAWIRLRGLTNADGAQSFQFVCKR